MCTDIPHSLHVFPCLLSPHMDACESYVSRRVSHRTAYHLAVRAWRWQRKRRTLEVVRLLRAFVATQRRANEVVLSSKDSLHDFEEC